MALVNSHNQSELTAAQLRDVLDYDPETGIFRWKEGGRGKVKAGAIAGSPCHNRGYRLMCVNYTRFLAHRLAWLYVHGEWPSGEVDHINGRTDDNSIGNLRVVTRLQNTWNSATRSHNVFGMRNIRPKGRKFLVGFSQNKKRIFHKSYPSLEAAIAARDSMAVSLYGEFATKR